MKKEMLYKILKGENEVADKVIKFELTQAEASDIITVLGELPTKTGAYPLAMKLKEQFEKQVPPDEK
jgi:hypothetical protein